MPARTLVLAVLALLLADPAAGYDLGQHRWRDRLLVLVAPDGADADLAAARDALARRSDAVRVVLASILGYWAGDFVNSYVLAKMKLLTRGRWLWSRTIGSTLAGQTVDSLIFYPIAFLGIWPVETMAAVILLNGLFKVAVEAAFTPLTYLVVNWLKRVEEEDYYDLGTDFTPFSLKD